VTGLVVGVYLGCIVLLSQVRPVRGNVGVAVSVLVAAALFNPLRRRVQVDLDVLGADLLGMVQHVLAPEHVSLWLCDQPEAEERAGADTKPVRY
jgi:hypothetical protein